MLVQRLNESEVQITLASDSDSNEVQVLLRAVIERRRSCTVARGVRPARYSPGHEQSVNDLPILEALEAAFKEQGIEHEALRIE